MKKQGFNLFVGLVLMGLGFMAQAQCNDADEASCENTPQTEIVIPEDDVLVPDSKIESADSVDSWFSAGFNELSLNKLNFILPSFIRLTPQSKLDGSLKWALKGISVLSLEADASVTGIRLSHTRLSTQPVIVSDVKIKGVIRWNRSAKTVSFENFSVGRQEVMAVVNGTVGYKGPTTINLKIHLPATDLQSALNALPSDLIPHLKGAEVRGKIALNTLSILIPLLHKIFSLNQEFVSAIIPSCKRHQRLM